MKGFSQHLYIIGMTLALLFAASACDKNAHDGEIIIPEGQGALNVGLNTDGVSNPKFEDTHIYAFDAAQKMALHKYYTTQKELTEDVYTMPPGAYTFVAVLNVGETFETAVSRTDAPLSDMTLSGLLNYLKQSEEKYPDMLTGMTSQTVTEAAVGSLQIPLANQAGGIVMCAVTVTLTLPDAGFNELQKTRAQSAQTSYNLRGVAEFYQKGKTVPVSRIAALLTPAATAGTYTLTAELPKGEYDMTLWVDYAEDGSAADLWYDTESLQAVKIIATDKVYTSGSDTRQVFYGNKMVDATAATADVNVTTERLQAKYRLIAEDVQHYKELMEANPDKYVPLDELSVSIGYESYLPDGFNAKTGQPNSSQTGYACNKTPLPTPADAATEVQIGSDHVFVNGEESTVTVTVTITDSSGRTVSRVKGVVVQYKRNMLTTVRGDFLTAGAVNPGINIDTDWDGVFDVEF